MSEFTIFGSTGFVGRNLVDHLSKSGHGVRAVTRRNWPNDDESLGHVIYTIGLTADFRTRAHDTIEAHVSLVSRLLKTARFESFLFLSSTRVYRSAEATSEETPLRVSSINPDHLYNLSKLCGEAICLAHPSPKVRIARLSNVFGDNNDSPSFLNAVYSEAVSSGRVTLGQALASGKDYVHVDDVSAALHHIAVSGQQRLYNVAAGFNTTHEEVVEAIAAGTGAQITVARDATLVTDLPIDISRLAGEMSWRPSRLRDYLESRSGRPSG